MFERPTLSTINTDQDAAICKAVGIVFPGSRLWYCMWHVRKHEMEHLQGYRARYQKFDHEYQRWVRCDDPAELEDKWAHICAKFNVSPRCWLWTMYDKRNHWVKSYLNDIFWADMTTTRRSESMNAYFYGYIHSNTILIEFVVQYDKAVATRSVTEEREDFQTGTHRTA